MLFIKLRAEKPTMQTLGTVGKEKYRQQIKGRCRQNRQYHADSAAQAAQPTITHNMALFGFVPLPDAPLISFWIICCIFEVSNHDRKSCF